MTQNQIIEGNKLIAEFMELPKVRCSIGTETGIVTEGYEHPFVGVPVILSGMQYGYSWDWLIPVVENISDVTGYELIVSYETSYWNRFGNYGPNVKYGGYSYGVIGLFGCVVGFIRWYNG